ncbi:uncharacterized protein LOC114864097 [Betta splendens]|uniref:Solute carrier family 22 member 6 n=1 Tax=Betta splendens TaxID=158456 RepID=A0A6P7NLB4_BETSP|nr:uncharacterized protein LOC114864097 [Betta splendens]
MWTAVMINSAGECVLFRRSSHPFQHSGARRLWKRSKMKFDNILSEINGFGKFQVRLVLLQLLSRLSMPCHFLLNNFMAAVPSHHCDLSALDDGDVFANLTRDQQLAVGVPAGEDGVLSSCQMFHEPQYQHLSGANGTNHTFVVECQNGWVYDNSTFRSTVVTEWDLVCSRKGMSKATATVFFIGVMFGAPLFGFLSDRYGRRPLLLVSYITTMVFAVISAFSTSYVMFAILRFFTGLSLAGLSIISIVLNVEWFGVEYRTFSGIIIGLDWTLGNLLLVGIAYCVNEWRMLILAASSPLILAILCWKWLPESARWLLANGKADAAHHYIKMCAEMNNRSKFMDGITPKALLDSAEEETKDKKYTCLDLFKTSNIRRLAICSGVVWYGVAFTYYGISLNISGFGVNPYLTQFIFGSIEIPMKIGTYFFVEKVGRRPGEVLTLLLTGLCLFINMFVAQDQWVTRTIVAVLGKAMSEAAFTIMYLYTTELYPTVVRQNGLGYTAFMARLGVSISPLVLLLEDAWRLLPAATYCAVAVGSGVVASLLPETLNTCLPEFIEDIEKRSAFPDMKFENVLAEVNGFGRFQLRAVLLVVVARVTLPFHFLLNNFIAFIPAHHCDLHSLDDGGAFSNLSAAERLAVGVPRRQDGAPDSCRMFTEPRYRLLVNASNATGLGSVPCQGGWVYDGSVVRSSLATEWDLVCDKKNMNRAVASIFFTGVMLGAAVFGYLSDRFGRKTTLLVCYVTTALFGFASALSPSLTVFTVMRFFTGMGLSGISIITYTLCIEWVDIKRRTALSIFMSMDWSLGVCLLPVAAYFVNDWRSLTAVVTAPLLPAIIAWWWLPESARWLLSNGRLGRAHFHLNECAVVNGRQQSMADLKPEILSKITLIENENRKYSYLDLVRTPRMRTLALRCGIVWFGVACAYYGISLSIDGFGVSLHLTQFIYGVTELPAKLLVFLALERLGRRLSQSGSLFLTGLCVFCNMFIPQEMGLCRTIIGGLGKMFSEASFTTVYLYTLELYPTVMRQNGLGYCSFLARIGVSICPLIMLLEDVWEALPGLLFSLFTLLSGFSASLLPETRNIRLPETIEEVEQTRRRSISTSD